MSEKLIVNSFDELFIFKKPLVAVLGGDDRELILVGALLDEGFAVNIFAQAQELIPEGAVYCQSIKKALIGVEAVVLPLAGINNDGMLYCKNFLPCRVAESDFSVLSKGTPVLCGVVSDFLKRIGGKYELEIMGMTDRDEVAIPNAIPTAEGAVALAIENSPGVLHESESLIIGFGRVGQALAYRLRALGSQVLIANRGKEREILAREMGYKVLPWDKLADHIGRFDYIFNTVPVLIITNELLGKVKNTVLIIDLASAPGGTDFKAAEEQNVKALFAPSLPGRFSPMAAGRILADVYPPLILEKVAQRRRGKP